MSLLSGDGASDGASGPGSLFAPGLRGSSIDRGPGFLPIPLEGALDYLDTRDALKFPILRPEVFPVGAWDTALLARATVAEFFSDAAATSIEIPPPDKSPCKLKDEITDLLNLRGMRDARSAEIMVQAEYPAIYWQNLLQTGPGRPHTTAIVSIAMEVASVFGFYWKRIYKRPRPAHVFPTLSPIISTPRHPSYPSNHALQAYVVREAVLSVMPEPVRQAMDRPTSQLANRIAENREIAGVHFRSDTDASWKISGAVFERLNSLKSFKETAEAAREEWATVEVGEVPDGLGAPQSLPDRIAERVARQIKSEPDTGAAGQTPAP